MKSCECGIYEIICVPNGRRYIGSAKDIGQRWIGHLKDLKRGSHHNLHLQRSWNKYGEDAFEFGVLELCSEPELLEREQAWMDSERPEFNIAKFADAPMRGRKASEQTKARQSKSQRGRRHSNATKARISAGNIGKKRTPEVVVAMKNRVFTAETKAKMSLAAKKKTFTVQHRLNMSAGQKRRFAREGFEDV